MSPHDVLELKGKRVTVVGLARSGVAVCTLLARLGAGVVASDRAPRERLEPAATALEALGVRVETGAHRLESFLDADLIVVSPGVPITLPPLVAARAQGIPLWDEVELAARLTPARFLGITGSNGKSTTTSLLGAMLAAAGTPSVVAGNIGTPLCAVAPDLSVDHWVVAELSSFQLETIVTFRPHVALLLNLVPDHLDRYPDLDGYYAAKGRIFGNQTAEDFAVLNADDPEVLPRAAGIAAQPLLFSRTRRVERGACLEAGQLVLRHSGRSEPVCGTEAIRIRGLHNLENALAAAAAAAAVGVPAVAMAEALRTFPGLPHRLELVGEHRGVRYINDSKGTNVGAVAKSLEGFERGVILIAGGRDKAGDFRPLRPLVASRVKALLLLGEARHTIREQLGDVCPMEEVGSLGAAVARGAALGAAGDTVLLSPACASFDMFRNFEHRGDVFREAVRALMAGRQADGRAG